MHLFNLLKNNFNKHMPVLNNRFMLCLCYLIEFFFVVTLLFFTIINYILNKIFDDLEPKSIIIYALASVALTALFSFIMLAISLIRWSYHRIFGALVISFGQQAYIAPFQYFFLKTNSNAISRLTIGIVITSLFIPIIPNSNNIFLNILYYSILIFVAIYAYYDSFKSNNYINRYMDMYPNWGIKILTIIAPLLLVFVILLLLVIFDS